MNTTNPAHRSVPVKGLSLTVKLVLLVAALVALFMAGFRLMLHGSLVDTIRVQIESEAVNAARTLAQGELLWWTDAYNTIDEDLTREAIQARVDAGTREEYEAYTHDPQRLAEIDWNRARLSRVLGDETRLVAAEIFRWQDGARLGTVASAYPGDRAASAAFESSTQPPVLKGAGEAQGGVLRVGEQSWSVIRGSYPVLGRDGAQEGEAVVFIDARAIFEAADAFGAKVLYAGLILIALSIVVAWLVARAVTSPVRRLRDDAEAVITGDLTHRTHPHSADEVGQVARTLGSLTKWLATALEAEREAEEEAECFRRDLAAAADVTASLFPARLASVPGWTLGGLHDREASPGGGIYDVLTMPDGKLGLFVAEASSGGAPGALVAAMTRSALRFAAERSADPGDVLREASRRLAPDLSEGLTAAVAFVVIDPATGKAAIASAGHRPVLHVKPAKDGLAAVLSDGPALGSVAGERFDAALKVAHVTVAPGDSLVVFASAIAMLSGPDGEVLGEKRLAALVKRAGGLPADKLVQTVGDALRRYHGGESLGADVTLVGVQRALQA